jgi:hypothetical protein
MKSGNWVPISKCFSKHLPKDRPYSRVEAAFSLQMDYDEKKPVTVAGYSALWQWSRNKVRGFLEKMGVNIDYPKNTKSQQNQKGQITIQIMDRSGEKKGQIRLIENKELQDQRGRYEEKKGQIMDRSKDTTRYPNTNPNKSLCPQQQIVDLYHVQLRELPSVKVWSEERQAALRSRWNQAVSNNNGLKSNCIEWWAGYFDYVRDSDFLMGRVKPTSGRKQFIANLEWLVKKQNFINILEGKYHS